MIIVAIVVSCSSRWNLLWSDVGGHLDTKINSNEGEEDYVDLENSSLSSYAISNNAMVLQWWFDSKQRAWRKEK